MYGLLRNMPSDSSMEIIRAAKEVLDGYRDVYEARQKELDESKGDRTHFQGNVRKFIEALFGVDFFPEKQVRMAVNAREVTVINDDGIRETIKVHGGFKYDGYLDLTRELRELLGFDEKWIGIAFEAQGSYWHNLPHQIEADRKKRLISREKNVILINIWENWDESTWRNEIIKQIEDQTGIDINQEKLNELKKYIGDKQV